MLTFVIHLVLSAALLLIVANLVSGIIIDGWGAALLAALILGVVNAVVRPVLVILTLPLTIVTFGLFLVVINAFMLQLVAALVPGFRIEGFGAAFLGAVLFALLGMAVDALLGPTVAR
jgi:putative membrane protein